MARVRIVFMGTPDLAATCLSRLLEAKAFELVAAVSQPDRPKGRRLQRQPTPVKTTAQQAGISVMQPAKARAPEFLDKLQALQPDLIAVAAYGQILPPALLGIPRYGCLNVHTSLLPRYRGAAPIQWAILNGDRETGVTIMKIAPALDAGDIISQSRTTISTDDDARTLHNRLAEMGAELLIQTIPDYIAGKLQATPQPTEGWTHARKIIKADGRVDWTRAAPEIWNQVRGLTPWPGAYTYLPTESKPALLKLWKAVPGHASGQPGTILQADKDGLEVACGEGSLRILEVQLEGKRRMPVPDLLAGHAIPSGTVLATE